ncbi:hypothetical protein P3T37_000397 [Kitasatospora sp. MAA4]|uniref:DUF6875 domain-containing protein n=1 Tax=Kitasatospora sp. MAA4 TaxID=3035093 RepID=UPI0024749225|nr:hypothetical protein [Kitasatospora sp. MAA4]MDH6131030.1 hypothetical protein [Kitasatospora sp. MAA4]
MTTGPSDGASHITAGALRLIEARSENPITVDVASYIHALYENCPFLEAARTRGMTVWTIYEISPGAHQLAVEADLFHAGVQAAEWIRLLARRQRGVPACDNIVMLDQALDADHCGLMTWPHWALKNLYGPVGVMFGKFTKGTQESDRFGRSIPPAPFSFLPVRTAVRSMDPRFLKDTPDLAAALAAAKDDGRDVFEHIPCAWKAVREWASSLPVPRKQ